LHEIGCLIGKRFLTRLPVRSTNLTWVWTGPRANELMLIPGPLLLVAG